MMQRLMTLPKRGNMSHVLPSVVELISSKDPPEAAVFMSESNTGTQSMTQSHTARRTATNSAGWTGRQGRRLANDGGSCSRSCCRSFKMRNADWEEPWATGIALRFATRSTASTHQPQTVGCQLHQHGRCAALPKSFSSPHWTLELLPFLFSLPLLFLLPLSRLIIRLSCIVRSGLCPLAMAATRPFHQAT